MFLASAGERTLDLETGPGMRRGLFRVRGRRESNPPIFQMCSKALPRPSVVNLPAMLKSRGGIPPLRPVKLRFTRRAIENIASIAAYLHPPVFHLRAGVASRGRLRGTSRSGADDLPDGVGHVHRDGNGARSVGGSPSVYGSTKNLSVASDAPYKVKF